MVKYFRYLDMNCCLIESAIGNCLLAIDAGWLCTLQVYRRAFRAIGYSFKNIKWTIVIRFHMGHAGLIEEFIKEGISCYAFENQTASNIDKMEKRSRRIKNIPHISK
jgi:hypothetical protein